MFTRRRSRSWQRKKSRQLPWYVTLALFCIGVPLGLELLVRAITFATGTDKQLMSDQTSAIVRAYQLRFANPNGQPYAALPGQGELKATRDPLLGYQLLPNQKNQFLTINAQGFREPEPLPVQKPSGEVRIFILGGSAAFGQLSSTDQTLFANKLEKLLNDQVAAQRANPNRFQPTILPYTAEEVAKVMTRPPRIPERQYQVVNAAVPGYASGNELALLMQQVANFSPDIVIVLNSYADLMLPSTLSGADIPGLDRVLEGKREGLSTRMASSIGGWFDQFYLIKAIEKYVLRSPQKADETINTLNLMTATPDQSLAQQFAANDKELDQRVTRYRDHLVQMVRWSSAARKRLLVGIQPEITGRKPENMTPEEKAIVASLGESYSERMQQGHAKVAAAANGVSKSSANTTVLDLYKLYETFAGQAFQSPTNLTDEANTVLAEKFFESIVSKLAIQPKPFEAGQ